MKTNGSPQTGNAHLAAESGATPARRIALLFPGQGSQRAGMGKRIAEVSQAARGVFDKADEVLGFRLSRLCFEGSAEELEDTANAQPAILTTSMAHLAYLRERVQEVGRRLRPSFVAGHSVGQFTAAITANALDFADGLRLVLERGRIMAEWARTRPGGLVAILGLSEPAVHQVCRDASPKGEVGVAVINGPGHTIISGRSEALQRATVLARERGARLVRRLPISTPGHTPLMRDAADQLAGFIDKVSFRDPDPPLVSNISARVLKSAEEVRQELSDQICVAVQWARCVVTMADAGVDTFVELGPGNALSKMVRRLSKDVETISTEDASPEALLSLTEALPAVLPAGTSRAGLAEAV